VECFSVFVWEFSYAVVGTYSRSFLFPLCTELYIHQDRSLNGTTNNASFWIFSPNIGGRDIVVGIATCYTRRFGFRTQVGGDIFRTHPEARLVFHTVCTRLRHDVDQPLPFGVEAECGSSYTLLGMLRYILSVFIENQT
jgi:hypothetical protein